MTQAERVYRAIRADIVGGSMRPSAALPFARLKSDYGASVGVLREALTRLAAEGLAVSEAQYGFRVMDVSLEDLRDLTSTRSHIEGLTLFDSVENGDLDWETRIIAAHHRLDRTPKVDETAEQGLCPAWSDAHHAFHMTLCSAAVSQRMLAIAGNLRASAEVYRRWSMPLETVERDVDGEHRELLDLCLARNAKDARDALIAHLELTQDIILAVEAPDRPAARAPRRRKTNASS